jgi:hypothetical protein
MNELMPARNPMRQRNMLSPEERRLLQTAGSSDAPLPELPNVSAPERWFREKMQGLADRYPNWQDYLPTTPEVGLPGGPEQGQASPMPYGGMTDVPKSVPAPEPTDGFNSRAGDMRAVLRTALHIRDDISPEAQQALDDFANSSEGRAISERIAAGDPDAANLAKQGLVRMLQGAP